MYIPFWIIVIGIVIYFFWSRKKKQGNNIEGQADSKFIGRHQQACAVKKMLGQNVPQMEIQIASNKDFQERKKLDESLKGLEKYVSSRLFGSMEQFAKTDIQMSFDSVAKISEVGYDTCVLQNDRQMEKRLLTIFINLSEYIKKLVSENTGKEFIAAENTLNSAVAIGTMKFLSLGGLLKTEEEKNTWIIMDSLDNPERNFGHFDKSNLVKISLTTIKNNSVKKFADELEKTANDLYNKQKITEREVEITKKMIEQGVTENFRIQGIPA